MITTPDGDKYHDLEPGGELSRPVIEIRTKDAQLFLIRKALIAALGETDVITPEIFRLRMSDLFGSYPEDGTYDEEKQHPLADSLLCEVLRELGYDEGVRIFEQASKWYS